MTLGIVFRTLSTPVLFALGGGALVPLNPCVSHLATSFHLSQSSPPLRSVYKISVNTCSGDQILKCCSPYSLCRTKNPFLFHCLLSLHTGISVAKVRNWNHKEKCNSLPQNVAHLHLHLVWVDKQRALGTESLFGPLGTIQGNVTLVLRSWQIICQNRTQTFAVFGNKNEVRVL